MALSIAKVEKTISAAGTWSNWIRLKNHFNFSLSGDWLATVTVQRSFDAGDTPLDVARFLSNAEEVAFEPEDEVFYRFGVKAGDYDSGDIVGRLSR